MEDLTATIDGNEIVLACDCCGVELGRVPVVLPGIPAPGHVCEAQP